VQLKLVFAWCFATNQEKKRGRNGEGGTLRSESDSFVSVCVLGDDLRCTHTVHWYGSPESHFPSLNDERCKSM
jgi:hypothetical protein